MRARFGKAAKPPLNGPRRPCGTSTPPPTCAATAPVPDPRACRLGVSRTIRPNSSSKVDSALRKAKADAIRRAFCRACEARELPTPTPEYRFWPERLFRFDYAWPQSKVALEVEGGVWSGGRHTRGSGFLKDIEKYSEAAARGWLVLRCTPDTLLTAPTLELVARCLALG